MVYELRLPVELQENDYCRECGTSVKYGVRYGWKDVGENFEEPGARRPGMNLDESQREDLHGLRSYGDSGDQVERERLNLFCSVFNAKKVRDTTRRFKASLLLNLKPHATRPIGVCKS